MKICFYRAIICDIIYDMRKCRFLFLGSFIALFASVAAHANWQYDGIYTGDGWYSDDGSRFILSVRGGASYGMATIENEIGTLVSHYYYNPTDGQVIPEFQYDSCADAGGCEDFVYLGGGDLGTLPAAKDFSSFAVAMGASLGWTVPYHPQWRLELGWDLISKAEYNQSPLFQGDLTLTGGAEDVVINVPSSSVQSKISTDIFSVMAFYDFYEGYQKPIRTVIPYVGLGVGYADSKTELYLADIYGDLSYDESLGSDFGEWNDLGVIKFFPSENHSSSVAALGALGMSYGITDAIFIDLGARVAYIPKIKWALSNKDDTRTRDWFSAKNMIYANVMLGLRFEF